MGAGPGFQWADIKVWRICLIAYGEYTFIHDPVTNAVISWTFSNNQTSNTNPNPWIGFYGFHGCPLNSSAGVVAWPPGISGGGINFVMMQHVFAAQAFYDWVVQETGPVNIGDQVEVDYTGLAPIGSPGNWPPGSYPTGTCGIAGVAKVRKICFEYMGELSLGSPNMNGTFEGAHYMNLARNCCEEFTVYPEDPIPIKYSWDCEIVSYDANPPYAANYGCVQKVYPQVGQYATQQDCINAGCKDGPGPTIPTTPIPS